MIVALWQPRRDTDSRLSDVDIDCGTGDGNVRKHKDDKWWAQMDNNPLPCIRVHWFVQPSDLLKVCAPRDHAAVSISQHFVVSHSNHKLNQNEIYYSLDHTTIIPQQTYFLAAQYLMT